MTRPLLPTAPSAYVQCLVDGHLDAVDDIDEYRRAIQGRPGWERCPRCGLHFPPATGDDEQTPPAGDPGRGWNP